MDNMISLLLQNWNNIKKSIKEIYDMPDFDYKLWIDPLSLHDYKDNTLTLSFPYYDDEILRYLENNYKDCLEETLGSLLSEKIEICFIISRSVSSEIKLISSELNPKFSFDNLIYSKNNSAAYKACWDYASSVVSDPDPTFMNLLYVYGEDGLGKTHILTAMGNYIKENSNKKVCFFTAQDFALNIDLNNKMRTEEFRKLICSYDVLLIDDVEYFFRDLFMADRGLLRFEFINIINTMINNNKLVVLTSNLHPVFMKKWIVNFIGVYLNMPEYKTSVAILEAYAKSKKSNIAHEILEYISEIETKNVNELKLIFNQINARAEFEPDNWKNDVKSTKKLLKEQQITNTNSEIGKR